MGQLTHNQVVQEAMELAGNTGLTARAQVWLGLILRELFEKSPLPMWMTGVWSTLPITPLSLAAGSQVLTANSASISAAAITPQTRSVRRIWIATMGNTDFSELQVEHSTTMNTPPRAYTGAVGVATGRPTRAFCVNAGVAGLSGVGAVQIYFDPVPDKTYAVWLVTEGFDLGFATYTAGQVNMYPNDLTVVQGVFALCLKHQQDERYAAEWAEFRRMSGEDRARFMQLSGANSKMRLAPGRFGSGSAKKPWDWMGPV